MPSESQVEIVAGLVDLDDGPASGKMAAGAVADNASSTTSGPGGSSAGVQVDDSDKVRSLSSAGRPPNMTADVTSETSVTPDPANAFLIHYVDLVRLARLLVDDRETAEEVVQDVFAAVQPRWHQFTDEGHALRYLRTAVVNRSRSVLRRRKVARAFVVGSVPSSPAADEMAFHNLEHAQLRTLIQSLPRRQREVVILRYYHDLPVAEVAAILGINGSAVKSSTSRALDWIEARMSAGGDR